MKLQMEALRQRLLLRRAAVEARVARGVELEVLSQAVLARADVQLRQPELLPPGRRDVGLDSQEAQW
jgi:hypothetical protein